MCWDLQTIVIIQPINTPERSCCYFLLHRFCIVVVFELPDKLRAKWPTSIKNHRFRLCFRTKQTTKDSKFVPWPTDSRSTWQHLVCDNPTWNHSEQQQKTTFWLFVQMSILARVVFTTHTLRPSDPRRGRDETHATTQGRNEPEWNARRQATWRSVGESSSWCQDTPCASRCEINIDVLVEVQETNSQTSKRYFAARCLISQFWNKSIARQRRSFWITNNNAQEYVPTQTKTLKLPKRASVV